MLLIDITSRLSVFIGFDHRFCSMTRFKNYIEIIFCFTSIAFSYSPIASKNDCNKKGKKNG